MSLTYCTECQTIEGKYQEQVDPDGHTIKICLECGNENSIIGIPEHDDLDMER